MIEHRGPECFPDFTFRFTPFMMLGEVENAHGLGTVQTVKAGMHVEADCVCGRCKILVASDNAGLAWQQVLRQIDLHAAGVL